MSKPQKRSDRSGKAEKKPETDRYQISSVSKLTGLNVYTIRAWEKRYGVVSPDRTETQRRLYGREDVQRLKLLRELVDQGHSIGSIAAFPIDQLQQLLSEKAAEGAEPTVRTVVTIGEAGSSLFEDSSASRGLEHTGHFNDIDAALKSAPPADVLLVDLPTVFIESIAEVQLLSNRLGATKAIVIYRFGPSSVVSAKNGAAGIEFLRAPTDARGIRQACGNPPARGETELPSSKVEDLAEEIPPTQFSPEQLNQIRQISSAIQCECPQHLANLLHELTSFEHYSAECENRNPQDAQLHASLHLSTARARALIEDALVNLLEVEGIQID